jgi:hypothetical protein
MHASAIYQLAYEIIINGEIAEVRQNNTGGAKSLHACKHFSAGEMFCTFQAEAVLPAATYLTIQVEENEHISLLPEYLRYTNHSCSPNLFFDTSRLIVECIKSIEPGEELTFFYPSSEWEMAQSFECCCGTSACIGKIQGAAHLSNEVLAHYRLTHYITRKLKERSSLKITA